jgi:hypothetical protein
VFTIKFRLPIAVAELQIAGDAVRASIVELDVWSQQQGGA